MKTKGMYSVRINMDANMVDIRYVSWDIICTPQDVKQYGMSSFLFSKEDARKLCMHLLLSHPQEQKGGWDSLHLCRHSKYPPYPCMEVIETFNVGVD